MISKNDLRANETKRAILAAAGKLFSQRGFDSVTMREIAKKAKCSHTTIYIYFKDKEALLHELSMPFLLDLKEQMESILLRNDLTSEGKLKSISYEFVRFCLFNRNMFTIFFATRATRVDSKEPVLEINKIRIELFELITRALRECLSIQQNDNRLLEYGRIYFYTLYGIVGTYTFSEESYAALSERLQPTFDDAIEVLLLGFQQKINWEVERE